MERDHAARAGLQVEAIGASGGRASPSGSTSSPSTEAARSAPRWRRRRTRPEPRLEVRSSGTPGRRLGALRASNGTGRAMPNALSATCRGVDHGLLRRSGHGGRPPGGLVRSCRVTSGLAAAGRRQSSSCGTDAPTASSRTPAWADFPLSVACGPAWRRWVREELTGRSRAAEKGQSSASGIRAHGPDGRPRAYGAPDHVRQAAGTIDGPPVRQPSDHSAAGRDAPAEARVHRAAGLADDAPRRPYAGDRKFGRTYAGLNPARTMFRYESAGRHGSPVSVTSVARRARPPRRTRAAKIARCPPRRRNAGRVEPNPSQRRLPSTTSAPAAAGSSAA